MTDAALVRHAIVGGVCTITLDSQHNRNALSLELVRQMHGALDSAEQASARVIVLTHAGPTFCAGADLKERAAGVIDSGEMIRAFQRLTNSPAPTIAAVTGAARAGGIGLIASCDLAVLAPQVTCAFSEVRIGVIPAIIAVPLLRRCNPAGLVAPFLTGAAFDAHHALSMGLATHVAEDVPSVVEVLIAGILQGAPAAVTAAKQLLSRPMNPDSDQAFAEMQVLSDSFFTSPDAIEGIAAQRDKRRPSWSVGAD